MFLWPIFSALHRPVNIAHGPLNTTASVPYWPRTTSTSYQPAMGHFVPLTTGPRCQRLEVSACLWAQECNMVLLSHRSPILRYYVWLCREDPVGPRRARGEKYSQSTERTDQSLNHVPTSQLVLHTFHICGRVTWCWSQKSLWLVKLLGSGMRLALELYLDNSSYCILIV